LDTTYHKLLTEQTAVYPHKDCFRNAIEDTKYTFAQVLRHQDAVASGMVEVAGRPGTSTVFALPLRTETFMTQLGAERAHRVWAPVQPGVDAHVLLEQLKALNPGTLVWPAKIHKTVQLDSIYEVFPQLEAHPRDVQLQDKRFPSLRQILHTAKTELAGMISYSDSLVYNNKRPLRMLEARADPKAKHTILLGRDYKTTAVSQHNMINSGYLVGKHIGIHEEDIVCTTLLLNTTAGLALGAGMCLPHKAKLVYSSEMFDPEELATTLAEEFCSVLVAQPSELHALCQQVTKPFPTLQKIVVAASPEDHPSLSLLESLSSRLGAKSVAVVFSSNAHVISVTPLNQFKDKSIGSPLPHTSVKIVNGSTVVPKGTVGSIVIKGFNAEDAEVNTGVLASMESDGSLSLH